MEEKIRLAYWEWLRDASLQLRGMSEILEHEEDHDHFAVFKAGYVAAKEESFIYRFFKFLFKQP